MVPFITEKMPGESEEFCEFYDVCREPFSIHGLLPKVEGEAFRRVPRELLPFLNPGFCGAAHTSGGRVRFATDSPFIRVRSVSSGYTVLPNLTVLCANGYDLYSEKGTQKVFKGVFKPPVDLDGRRLKYVGGNGTDFAEDSSGKHFTATVNVGQGGMRQYTLNMPIFSGVEELYIGVKKGSKIVAHSPYTVEKPVVYYGSSITHGASASRAGLMYQNMISRNLDCDYISFGFSGSAKGEPAMAEYFASFDMSAFVMDYDHNAPNAEHLSATHERFFAIIREKRPNLPVIFVSRPDGSVGSIDVMKRKTVIFDTFRNALEKGDKNVYFVDGISMFPPGVREDCTCDGCHPNDLGFYYMSLKIGEAVRDSLQKQGYRV